MRRISMLCATAGLAIAAFAGASQAKAGYHLIRWSDSGFCQIWDQSIPTTPWPANFAVVSEELPTFDAAFSYKTGLLNNGTCSY